MLYSWGKMYNRNIPETRESCCIDRSKVRFVANGSTGHLYNAVYYEKITVRRLLSSNRGENSGAWKKDVKITKTTYCSTQQNRQNRNLRAHERFLY